MKELEQMLPMKKN